SGPAEFQGYRTGCPCDHEVVPACAAVDEVRAHGAPSVVPHLFTKELQLLATLRTRMGWRGFRDVSKPRPARPVRNPKYLASIRTLPCLVCGARRGIEASHTGPHGLGQKSPDTSAIPLCITHHRTGKDSYHKLGPRK